MLAETDRAVELDETGLPTRFYIPREDVKHGAARAQRDHLALPVQGRRDVLLDRGRGQDAFWVYEAPNEDDAQPIAGLLAPWPGRVEVVVD